MAERIELPQKSGGGTEAQLESMYRYLYQMAVALNHNLAEIGGAALTDGEMKVMDRILREAGEGTQPGAARDAETLKSMIIKTAAFIKTAIDEYNLKLVGTVQAEGKLGRYVRKTGLDVAVNPEGIEQKFTFEEVIQGLKEYEINAKNYIKSGLLRTVDGIPVYGVAVGKDIVTFAEDGTETYHDGNKVAEYTADGISFYQNSVMIAKYTGNRISFYYGGSEIFYIQAGKIYCVNDMTIGSGKKLTIQTGGEFCVEGENGSWTYTDGGIEYEDDTNGIFEIKDTDNENSNATVGIYYRLYPAGEVPSLNRKYGEFVFKTLWQNGDYLSPSKLTLGYTQDGVGRYRLSLFSSGAFILGTKEKTLRQVHTEEIIGDTTNKTLTLCANFDDTGGSRRESAMTLQEASNALELLMNSNFLGVTRIGNSSHRIGTIYGDYVDCNHLVQNSSREIKHDIADMKSPGERLEKLRPVTFVYNDDKEGRIRQGLILEETREIMPEICTEDGINYLELVPMLLKEVQELRARVTALEEKAKGE